MIRAPGIEHVGHQHDVIVGRELDAAQREHLQVEFQVVADFEHSRVFEQRLHGRERYALLDLPGRDVGRRTGCRCRRRRLCDGRAARNRPRWRASASEKPHSVACIGSRLVVSVSIAIMPQLARARDPSVEPFEATHDLVVGAIDLRVASRGNAGGGERLRRELGFVASPLAGEQFAPALCRRVGARWRRGEAALARRRAASRGVPPP